MGTGALGRWFMVAATLIIGGVFTSSIAIGQEVECPCFDANQLKQESRFINDVMTSIGVKPLRYFYVENDVLEFGTTETAYRAEFEWGNTYYDTYVYASIREDRYLNRGYGCYRSFWLFDERVLPAVEKWNLTQEETEACAVEIATAYTKLLKDVN
jgi:hypothetical protein